MQPLFRPVVLATLVVALTACGDGPETAATTTSGPTNTTATSTTTSAVTTSTTTPTTAAAATCGNAALPSGASDTVSAPADLDGDGAGDTVTSYRVGPADDPEWHLHVQLASGGGVDRTLPAPTGPSDERVVGASDANENGVDEVWVKVGAGAAAQIVSPFVLDGCDLVQVTLDGDDPAEFPVGGSVGTTGGVYCADEDADGVRDVVFGTAEHASGSQYDATIEVYHLVGTDLAFRFGDAGGTDADSSGFQRFTRLDCDDAQL